MDCSHIKAVLSANAPEALTELCGVTLLERLLRILQRLGFHEATIFSATPNIIRAELGEPSWPRNQLSIQILNNPTTETTAGRLVDETAGLYASSVDSLLIVPGAIYCDPRLLGALAESGRSAALVDSKPPESLQPLLRTAAQTAHGYFCGAALVTRGTISELNAGQALFDQLGNKIDTGKIDIIDAAAAPDYVPSLRRHLRPLFFPAPRPEDRKLAERTVLDTTQHGTLDLPAYIHAPIENSIIKQLCRTRITPNQITIFGFILGCVATLAFLFGHVVLATILALIFGVIDGLDGKQARLKIETTRRGKWEHELDYVVENSWWIALAFHLWKSGQLPGAFYFLALLIGSDLIDRLVRYPVKKQTGRLLDDVAPFDRAFRLIGGRRNVYVWMLACGLFLGAVGKTFALVCEWSAVTAFIHLARSIWICKRRLFAPSEGGAARSV